MPSINLRLSETELEQLRQWAYGSRRSLQREIVFRLFQERHEAESSGAAERDSGVAQWVERRQDKSEVAGSSPVPGVAVSNPRMAAPDDHFKPDFGSKLK